MSAPPAVDALAELRRTFGEVLGAERRLRSRKKAHEDELTVAQIRALIPLCGQASATAGELAKFADLNPASMTAMLDHLESAGIVHRERSEDDRRVVFVSLTAQGSELVQARRRVWEQKWQEALGDLPAGEVEIATRVLARVAALLDAAAHQDD